MADRGTVSSGFPSLARRSDRIANSPPEPYRIRWSAEPGPLGPLVCLNAGRDGTRRARGLPLTHVTCPGGPAGSAEHAPPGLEPPVHRGGSVCTVGEGAALALGLGPGEVAWSPSPVGEEEECPLGAGMGRQMARAWCRGPRAAAATVKVIGGCYRRCSLFGASALESSQGAGGPPEQGGRVGELPERSRGAREGTRPPCTLAVRDPPRPLLLTGVGQTSPCFPTQGETFARKPEPDGRSSRSPRPVPAHGALGSAFGFLARRPDRGRGPLLMADAMVPFQGGPASSGRSCGALGRCPLTGRPSCTECRRLLSAQVLGSRGAFLTGGEAGRATELRTGAPGRGAGAMATGPPLPRRDGEPLCFGFS